MFIKNKLPKILLSIFLSLALMLGLLSAGTATAMAGTGTIWDGTADTSWYNSSQSEFTITTAEQLAGLAQLVNNGNKFQGKTVKLGADIVLNNTTNWQNWGTTPPANTWTPIGDSNNYFAGNFDGQEHAVSGMYINTDTSYKGLFGYSKSDLTIPNTLQNLDIIDSYVKGNNKVGGVAGYLYNTNIINCYNSGQVNGKDDVGGVAGYIRGNMESCYNTGFVSGSDYVGGLAGYLYYGNDFTSCYNIGSVSGNDYVGGIIGYSSQSDIASCYNIGSVVSGGYYAGGMIGNSLYSDITNCYNIGSVSGSSYVGGMTGKVYSGSINYSYNTGSISGKGITAYLAYTTITNCYYLDSCASDNGYGTAKDASAFSSGEVSQLLQASQSSPVWGQTTLSGSELPLLIEFNTNALCVHQILFYNTASLIKTAYALDGETIDLPTVSKVNDTFTGWNTVADGTGTTFTSTTAVTSDITLYAQWASSASCTVTFDKNGGTTDASPTTMVVTSGNKVGSLPTAPSRGGYTFAGWNTLANGSGAAFKATTVVTANITVYAQWTIIPSGTVWNGTADTSWYESNLNEFTINNASQLAGLAQLTRSGNNFQAKTVKLGANILLNEADSYANEWTPISGFWGTFDGQGHTISGVYYNSLIMGDYIGLFSSVGSQTIVATIKNLGVINSYIEGMDYVGGLVGYARQANIINCYTSGVRICGRNNVGGLAGYIRGNIENCYNTCPLLGCKVGGLVGQLEYGSVKNSYNTGNVASYLVESIYRDQIFSMAGGIAGATDNSNISNCYNTGYISGVNSSVSGICPNGSGITNCYYLNSCAPDNGYGTAKDASAFADGEVTWNLQGEQSSLVWGQNALGGSNVPLLIVLNTNAKQVHQIVFYDGDSLVNTAYVLNRSTVSLPVISNPGFYLAGWNTEVDGSGITITERISITKSMTLYAQWSDEETYIVDFAGNYIQDVITVVCSKIVVRGGSVDSLPTISRLSNHVLTGWNTEADGSGITFTTSTVVNSDLTVYAQWREITPGDYAAGLNAYYYDNLDMGNPVYKRMEAQVTWPNINLGGGSPDPLIDPDTFSIIYQGYIRPPEDGTYTFCTYSDDGVRMILDGTTVIDRLEDINYELTPGTPLSLSGGNYYSLELDYFENRYSATLFLFYSKDGGSLALVPPSWYYSDSALTKTYYNNVARSGSGLTIKFFNEEEPDFDTDTPVYTTQDYLFKEWRSGSPDPAVNNDHFSFVAEGYIEARYTEELNLQFVVDDGIRVYIDDVLMIDEWHGNSDAVYSLKFNAVSGQKYKIRIEYCEKTLSAKCCMFWYSDASKKEIIPLKYLYPIDYAGSDPGSSVSSVNFGVLTDALNKDGDWYVSVGGTEYKADADYSAFVDTNFIRYNLSGGVVSDVTNIIARTAADAFTVAADATAFPDGNVWVDADGSADADLSAPNAPIDLAAKSGSTLTLGTGSLNYIVDSHTKYYILEADGDIVESDLSALSAGDKVFVVTTDDLSDYQIQYVFIVD